MIPHHIKHKPGNDNYRALALYAADARSNGDTGEKTLMSWQEGCLADNYLMGLIEVEATQAMNTRTAKEKTYHLMVSFRPEDEARLSPEIFKDIERHLAKAIGFDGHQRHCGVHKNTDNVHMHVAYNMIEPEKFTRHMPYYDYPKLHKACRELEVKYGLAIDPGMSEVGQPKDDIKHVKAAKVEAHTGQQSFFSYVDMHKKIITKIVQDSSEWEQVHEAFLKLGLELKLSGNGLAIKDRFGKHHIKASDISRSLSKSQLVKKLGSFQAPTEEQSQIKAEAKYDRKPLHDYAEKDQFYAQFQSEMKQRKAVLEAIAAQEKEIYNSNKTKWEEKRKAVDNYAMLPADRRRVMQILKAEEDAELARHRISVSEQKKKVREAMPYTSWTKFLQHKAAKGNETALDILRSKRIQPELCAVNSDEKMVDDLKATIESKKRQIEIQNIHGINQKHRRALITVVQMEELIAKESGFKSEHMTHKIDTKGVVIFSLKSGGTIRDTGTEIHFSSHDKSAKELAEKLAKMKWGRGVSFENDIIKMSKTYNRGMSR